MTERPAPLGGLTVVDLTQVLAGPYCTYQLALLGAEVVKIEPPGGEWTRAIGGLPELSEHGLGLSFCVLNGDKQLVALDLKDPAGLDAVLALVDDADVVVENFRPGVADRLGLGSDALLARNPALVYCSVSAFGATGPLGGRPAYDHVVQAMSGVMELTGPAGSDPVKVGVPYLDYATGMTATTGILAALRERDRTGVGQLVDVSMLDVALSLMAGEVAYVASTGNDLPKLGNEPASGSPASGCFRCGDGRWLQFVANTDRQFERLCVAVGRERWATDERWSTGAARRVNRRDLQDALREVLASAPAADWEARLARAGVPASVVRRVSDVLATGQPAARGLLHHLEVGPDATSVAVPGLPFVLNGTSLGPRTPPRAAGADNERRLGVTRRGRNR